MTDPLVHFEIIGADPARLRSYYGSLFGWQFQVGDTVSREVSEPGEYGFVDGSAVGLNGGVGGGSGHAPKALFYIGVDDVGIALDRAEELGGKRVFGPDGVPGKLVVGQFTDPEGNLVGVAGPK